MRDLYLSELRRFRNPALIAGAVHLVVLVFLSQMLDLFNVPLEVHLILLGIYVSLCAALALYQFGTYRQPSRWLWLLHRPLPASRIFTALALASATLLALTVALPVLGVALFSDMVTERMVDGRAYLLVVHLYMFALMAWFCGAFVMLSRSKLAAGIVVVPAMSLLHLASGWVMLIPAFACILLLAYIAFTAFKPDRLRGPTTTASTLAIAIPILLGFYFLMAWSGSVASQFGMMLTGTHPLNRDIPYAGGHTEGMRAKSHEAVLLGLAASKDPRATRWTLQVKMSEGVETGPIYDRYQVRHAISNRNDSSFRLKNATWSISHDTMLFHSRKPVGTLGTGGFGDATPFDVVPEGTGNDKTAIMATPHALYLMIFGTDEFWTAARFGQSEWLTSAPVDAGNFTWLLTNQRIVQYDKAVPSDRVLMVERGSIPLAGPSSDLSRVDIVPLLDGQLVSAFYGSKMYRGTPDAQHIVYFMDEQGKAQEVARRPLTHDYNALFEHRYWWLSPALHAVSILPEMLLDVGAVPDHIAQANPLTMTRPAAAWAAAILASLLSGAIAWWWLQRSATPPRARRAWIMGCLLLGLPALFAVIALNSRVARLAPLPDTTKEFA